MVNHGWEDELWQQIVRKVSRTWPRIGASFPYASVGGMYNNEGDDWWTNGFWPGLLWLIYRETGQTELRETAEAVEARMDAPLQAFTPLHHDVGFMWSLTSVANYKLTGGEESRRRALTAASHLAGRWNARGGFLRAWNQPERTGWSIIDTMMNLPLLFWASEETGDPRFRHIAELHADMAQREFIRADGSTHHIVCFDPETGERTGALGGQGYAPDSAWSRGAGWALYGMALAAKYTGKASYRETAERVAAFFLEQLPESKVAPWDFRAPLDLQGTTDASASLIAACGMLELAELAGPQQGERHRAAAADIVRGVNEHCGAWDDPAEEGLIRGASANVPRQAFVNVPIIYGDYFFAEAILRLRGKSEVFW